MPLLQRRKHDAAIRLDAYGNCFCPRSRRAIKFAVIDGAKVRVGREECVDLVVVFLAGNTEHVM